MTLLFPHYSEMHHNNIILAMDYMIIMHIILGHKSNCVSSSEQLMSYGLW